MRAFSRSRRGVPKARRKYGRPETKKDALERLRREREVREMKTSMIRDIRFKNKDEFHFSFYSVDKNMTRRTAVSQEELTRILRYIDSEILRCERILENAVRAKPNNRHIKFDVDEAVGEASEEPEITPTSNEYEEYIQDLMEKRKDVVGKLNKLKT